MSTGQPVPDLDALAAALRASRGFAHKADIAEVMQRLGTVLPPDVKVGDDCAALRQPDGSQLLFAIEGFVDDFVERMPWFAGWCGVMVNASDIYAMGGRPLAVVDALWSEGSEAAAPVLAGLAEASRRYGIPIVGGHSNQRSRRSQLAVAIVGRAQALLTSFDARPGDALLMAIDLRGAWQEPYPYWNAATEAPAERLRADLELLPGIAEAGLAVAAKDISMAGALGTAMMLLECSGCGAVIDPLAVPRPAAVDSGDPAALLRWLSCFPSYGFVLSVAPTQVPAVLERFAGRDIAAAVVGEVRAGSTVTLRHGADEALLWDFAARRFITARSPAADARP
jgi:AIR synthase-related protein